MNNKDLHNVKYHGIIMCRCGIKKHTTWNDNPRSNVLVLCHHNRISKCCETPSYFWT